jgi:DNA-directed RNA polymerase subunit F
MEQTKEDIGKIVSGVKADLQAAKASYEQILQLEGVEKYKEYAEKMLEVVEKDEELLAQVEALIAKFMQMLSSMQPGTMPDLSVLLESEEMKKINELSETIDNLMNEANKLKKELE